MHSKIKGSYLSLDINMQKEITDLSGDINDKSLNLSDKEVDEVTMAEQNEFSELN
jgi:hypothetical protein